MLENNAQFSRRGVLKSIGGTLAAASASGLASAGPKDRVEVNVGYRAAGGRQAATQAANEVVREFNFEALTIRVPKEALKGLRQRPDVRYVEENGSVQALAQDLPWGVDRVDADIAHGNGDTGAGADIAIIDTGIDSDHPDLQANLGAGTAFANCSGSSCNETWDDDDDHGTHCAGIAGAADNTEGVVGVAPEATLHAVKVLDSTGGGSFSDVAAGIEYVADQGWDVGSLSLGASSGSQTIRDAVQYADSNGVLLVAAAGNSGPCSDCVGYPAAYSEVIAVSSTDSDDSLSSFSSTGPEVNIAAPGGSIYSTLPGGYGTLSGTSMSTPHVAGAAAQLMANGASNTQARQQLLDSAEDIGLASNESGSGLLDVEAALASDGGDGGDGGTGSTAPTVDSVSVSNRSNGGWARFTVDWSVGDADADLASVDLSLTQSATVDSTSQSVSGSSASGSTQLQEKKGSGSYDVTVTVTDSAGNTASQTVAVSA